jgi:hypothetical protein
MRNASDKPPVFGLISLACHNEKRAEDISNADSHASAVHGFR